MLLSPDEYLALTDCGRRVRFLTKWVRGEDFEFRADFEHVRDAVVIEEVNATGGRHERTAVMSAEPLLPFYFAGACRSGQPIAELP